MLSFSQPINWERLEAKIGVVYTDGDRQLPILTRLLAGHNYLKYAFDESDETMFDRLVESLYWQYFCGFEFFQHKLPLHSTSIGEWRKCVWAKSFTFPTDANHYQKAQL